METKYFKNIKSIANITIATIQKNQETGETFEHIKVIERIGEYNELLGQIAVMANVTNYTIGTYIFSVSTIQGQTIITAEEYDKILSVFKTMPKEVSGFGYRLKDDLTWEKYEVPVIEEEIEDEVN